MRRMLESRADIMENVGSWNVSGSKEAMEVPKNSKDLQKHDIRDIVQYSKRSISCIFFNDIHFFHSICHVYRSVWPSSEAKPHFGAMLGHSVQNCETHLLNVEKLHQVETT